MAGRSSRCAATSACRCSGARRPGFARSSDVANEGVKSGARSEQATNFVVRKAAVLGAGVMGAQIAAQLVNAQVDVVLFDLPAREGPKNGVVTKAIEGLKKLNPAPLGHPELAAYIAVANYDDDLELLRGCDLVIEAIAER
ncbi:MAG: hypothetical protein IT508_05045, partial [Burkholderiaceae bacterium]|nr:hypothetical protein [Burkholderiaceae bacterium]